MAGILVGNRKCLNISYNPNVGQRLYSKVLHGIHEQVCSRIGKAGQKEITSQQKKMVSFVIMTDIAMQVMQV